MHPPWLVLELSSLRGLGLQAPLQYWLHLLNSSVPFIKPSPAGMCSTFFFLLVSLELLLTFLSFVSSSLCISVTQEAKK